MKWSVSPTRVPKPSAYAIAVPVVMSLHSLGANNRIEMSSSTCEVRMACHFADKVTRRPDFWLPANVRGREVFVATVRLQGQPTFRDQRGGGIGRVACPVVAS